MSFLYSLSSRRFCFAAVTDRRFIQKVLLPSHRLFVTMTDMDKIADVLIDKDGRFKYILVEIRDKTTDVSKKVVWGSAEYPYHADTYDALTDEVNKYPNLVASSCGGGFVLHSPKEKTLKLFGISQGLGPADHEVTADVLKKKYPDYKVTWSSGDSP